MLIGCFTVCCIISTLCSDNQTPFVLKCRGHLGGKTKHTRWRWTKRSGDDGFPASLQHEWGQRYFLKALYPLNILKSLQLTRPSLSFWPFIFSVLISFLLCFGAKVPPINWQDGRIIPLCVYWRSTESSSIILITKIRTTTFWGFLGTKDKNKERAIPPPTLYPEKDLHLMRLKFCLGGY